MLDSKKQNTPTVHFQFEDSYQKTNLSKEALLAYSCTNNKFQASTDQQLNVQNHQFALNSTKARTSHRKYLNIESFFDQFQDNYVVFFQDQQFQVDPFDQSDNEQALKSPENQSSFSKVCQEFHFLSLTKQTKQTDKFQSKEQMQNDSKIISKQFQSKQGLNLVPTFEIKKRTQFKRKQNIIINPQNYKITKKKFISTHPINIFQSLRIEAKSCQMTQKTFVKQKNILTLNINKQNSKLQATKHANIFSNHSKFKQTLKSATLDHLKRKHVIKKNEIDKKTLKRTNIFFKPFSLRQNK